MSSSSSETTLGSPSEPLSPCFWAGDGGQKGRTGAAGAADASGERERSDDRKLARLSDVCSALEAALAPSPAARPGQADAARRAESSQTGAAGQPRAQKALMLSPGSQLDVLSQISELAERSRLEAGPAQAPGQPPPPTGSASRSHVWAAAQRRQKKRAEAGDAAAAADGGSFVALLSGQKKRKTQAPQHSDKLEADMLDWETCSEDLFLDREDAQSDDAWEFEDVSDSDFD